VTEPPSVAEPTESLLRHAENLIAVRRYADALPWAAQAIGADPHDARPHCLLAFALLRMGEYRRALRAAETAVVQDPTNEWAHRLRSAILMGVGKKRQALAAAQEAARLGPDVPEALYTLMVAQLACHNAGGARATTSRLAAIAPDSAFTHEAMGHLALATGQVNGAEVHFRRALAIDPQDVEMLNALGVALHRQGKRVEALERFRDAAHLDPTADFVKVNMQASLRGYLYTLPLMLVTIAVFHAWRWWHSALPVLGPAALLVTVACIVALLLWRRDRIRSLPPHLALLARHERIWGPRSAIPWITVVGTTLLGILLLGDALNATRFTTNDWIEAALLVGSLGGVLLWIS
jgi:Flp pilus assembly protein TadD